MSAVNTHTSRAERIRHWQRNFHFLWALSLARFHFAAFYDCATSQLSAGVVSVSRRGRFFLSQYMNCACKMLSLSLSFSRALSLSHTHNIINEALNQRLCSAVLSKSCITQRIIFTTGNQKERKKWRKKRDKQRHARLASCWLVLSWRADVKDRLSSRPCSDNSSAGAAAYYLFRTHKWRRERCIIKES